MGHTGSMRLQPHQLNCDGGTVLGGHHEILTHDGHFTQEGFTILL